MQKWSSFCLSVFFGRVPGGGACHHFPHFEIMRRSGESSTHGCSAASEKPGRWLWPHQAGHGFWRVTHTRPWVNTTALKTFRWRAYCCVDHPRTPLKRTEQTRKWLFLAGCGGGWWKTRHVRLCADLVSTDSWVHLREKYLFIILYLRSYNRKIRTFVLRQYQVLWAPSESCIISMSQISLFFAVWDFCCCVVVFFSGRAENLLAFWNLGISSLCN